MGRAVWRVLADAQKDTGGAQLGARKSARGTKLVRPYQRRAISLKWLAAGAIVLFAAWLPYLLVYWPGLIFGDSTASLAQAQYMMPFYNHHPVFFTLLIKACIWLAAKAGFGTTIGCALFCLCQMTTLALVFSYQINWLRARFRAHWIFCVAALLVLAFSPYVATYSIALWKDPLFSAALVVLTLMLADCVLGSEAVSVRFAVALGIVALLVCLLRNNGIYIATLLLAILGITWLVRRQQWTLHVACSLLFCVVTAWAITGPLYAAAGVFPSEKEESLGVPLAQMARVVATDGNMTDADREYMNSLFPFEEYEAVYQPCLIDSLKFHSDFHSSALDDGFWEHYASMLVQNPGTYAEAWALQTFGFWTVNVPAVIGFNKNISYGVPHFGEVPTRWGVYTNNLLGSDELKDVFPLTGYSVPIGIIFWALLYLGLCAVLLGRSKWLLVLVPSLALVCTLIIASPVYYWPRYAAALQFLLPLWIALFAECFVPCKPAES